MTKWFYLRASLGWKNNCDVVECNKLTEAIAAYEEALSLFNKLLGSKDRRSLMMKAEISHLKNELREN